MSMSAVLERVVANPQILPVAAVMAVPVVTSVAPVVAAAALSPPGLLVTGGIATITLIVAIVAGSAVLAKKLINKPKKKESRKNVKAKQIAKQCEDICDYANVEEDLEEDFVLQKATHGLKPLSLEQVTETTGKAKRSVSRIRREKIDRSVCTIKTVYSNGSGSLVRIPLDDYGLSYAYGIMTCNHVLDREGINCLDSLDVEINFAGLDYSFKLKSYHMQRNFTDKVLDATFIELDPTEVDYIQKVHNELFLNTFDGRTELGDAVIIVGHPSDNMDRPKSEEDDRDKETKRKYPSVGFGSLKEKRGVDIEYDASTNKGTSGAPVLNIKGKVIGVHKAGSKKKNLNRGTAIEPIIQAIREKFLEQKELGNKHNTENAAARIFNLAEVSQDECTLYRCNAWHLPKGVPVVYFTSSENQWYWGPSTHFSKIPQEMEDWKWHPVTASSDQRVLGGKWNNMSPKPCCMENIQGLARCRGSFLVGVALQID